MINWLIYVDPGSGSYLIQIIIAGVLAAVFWFKSSWLYIKSFFTRKKTNNSQENALPKDDV